MSEIVIDASVAAKWYRSEGERHVAKARALERDFTSGALAVVAPPLLLLELVNIAARKWRLSHGDLLELATTLERSGFELAEPDLVSVAAWAGRGLTAYDAVYVALAEARRLPLVTDDDRIVEVAGDIARPLASV